MAGWKRRRLDKVLSDVGIIDCETTAGMARKTQGVERVEIMQKFLRRVGTGTGGMQDRLLGRNGEIRGAKMMRLGNATRGDATRFSIKPIPDRA